MNYQNKELEPVSFKLSLPPPFNSFDQQDSSEFGRMYISILQEILDSKMQQHNIKNQANYLKEMFFGQITNQIQCKKCNTITSQSEEMMDITASFGEDTKIKNSQSHSLEEMIKNRFSTEELMDDNEFYCDKCKQLNHASQIPIIDTLPPYLIISVNRFIYNKDLFEQFKLTDRVDIPFELSLKKVFPELRIQEKQGCEYKLYAFIVHLGQNANSGHYTSFTRDIEDQQKNNHKTWYNLDDNYVNKHEASCYTDFDKEWNEAETPYLLFYVNDSKQPINLKNYTRKTSLIKRSSNLSTSQYSQASTKMEEETIKKSNIF